MAMLSASCLLLVLVSCKKYLNQRPITDVSVDVVFKDVPSTYKALAGAYSRLVGDAGFGIRLSLYYTVDNDEMQGPTGAGDNDRRDIARFSATSGNAQITNPFNQLFQGIEFSNICIDNIPKMDMYTTGSDNQKKQLRRMLGEALTLRAQYYFEAIVNWGDLPKHFVPASTVAGGDPFPKRTDRDSLYAQLLADLKTAEDLVPWRNELTAIGDPVDERITKAAVKGLRARIALFRGGWSLRQTGGMQRGSDYLTYYQIAKEECNDIMASGQHILNPSFKALWKNQVCAHAVTDPNGELIFQASAIGLSGAEDTKLGYYNGPRVNNLGNSSVNPLPSFVYLFDSTDQRRDVTVCHYFTNTNGTRIGQAITNLTDGKYRRDWISNPAVSPTDAIQYFGLKWQILRLSDVYLMFAEAENEINGPTAAAYNAINMVRRRGYGKPISTPDPTVDIPSGLTKSDFFRYIIRERSLELAGEGVRKFDLIRWNLLATALQETKDNMTRMSAGQAMINPSYMAGYPSYSLTSSLPAGMYYFINTTSDDNNIGGLWDNSLYKPTPPNPTVTVTTDYTLLATDYGVIVKGQNNIITLPDAVANAGRTYWLRFTPNNPAATSTADWTYNMKVNAINGQTINGSIASFSYSGTVTKATPPNQNGPAVTIGFYSNGTGWMSATSVAWVTNAIGTIPSDNSPVGRYARGFVTGKGELLPIPQPARDANVNLTQNPGY